MGRPPRVRDHASTRPVVQARVRCHDSAVSVSQPTQLRSRIPGDDSVTVRDTSVASGGKAAAERGQEVLSIHAHITSNEDRVDARDH